MLSQYWRGHGLPTSFAELSGSCRHASEKDKFEDTWHTQDEAHLKQHSIFILCLHCNKAIADFAESSGKGKGTGLLQRTIQDNVVKVKGCSWVVGQSLTAPTLERRRMPYEQTLANTHSCAAIKSQPLVVRLIAMLLYTKRPHRSSPSSVKLVVLMITMY